MGIGPLNLSDADMSGGDFEPLPPGQYEAEVFDINVEAVKNASGTGKLPAGTPMISVQFRITQDGFYNRRVWTRYIIPPEGYNPTSASRMKGMLVRFFTALGTPEEQVRANGFNPDFEDYKGKTCILTLGKRQRRDQDGNPVDQYDNEVRGIKPMSAGAGTGASSGLL